MRSLLPPPKPCTVLVPCQIEIKGYRGNAGLALEIIKAPRVGIQHHAAPIAQRPETILDWNRRMRAQELRTIKRLA